MNIKKNKYLKSIPVMDITIMKDYVKKNIVNKRNYNVKDVLLLTFSKKIN